MALLDWRFKSETLDIQTAAMVVVNDSALRWAKKRAPLKVLYLLHGLSDDHTIWQRRTSIERHVDNLDLLVVMPNVHRSFYANMAHGGRYWDFVSEELPAITRAFFPVSQRREDTFVAGLSMGGYGAFKLALSRPESFAAAGSFSGALDIGTRVADPNLSKEWLDIFGNAPLRGSDHDVIALAKKLVTTDEPRPRLYQWCGTEDFLYQENLTFRDAVEPLGFDYTYEDSPGDHSWGYWDTKVVRFLEWLKEGGSL